jgi:hypothetical protein
MPKLPKKLMRFTIQELSAVASPAQEPAVMAIMKSDGPAGIAKARADFAGVVANIAKRDRIPQHMAMAKARTECPDAFAAAYSGGPGDVSGDQQLGTADTVSKARSDLMGIARDIAKTENCGLHIAMTKARRKRPDLFESL